MPELPDVVVYLHALERHAVGHVLERVHLKGVSTLASFDPPISAAEGRTIIGTSRLGKRLVLHLDEDLHLVIHLMIAGRIRRRERDPTESFTPPKNRNVVATFQLDDSALVLTEAATKKRARIWLVRGADRLLADHDRGGAEPLEVSEDEFSAALVSRNRTLKRALTDPATFSGIGNAYSDEILHRARLSPTQRTQNLDAEAIRRLYLATVDVLDEWTRRLDAEVGDGFPDKVTAFRPEMAAHGKFSEPCPVCATPIQRIVKGAHETNYCPGCQTGGKVLADRSLSRLLKDDWPSTLEELEGL